MRTRKKEDQIEETKKTVNLKLKEKADNTVTVKPREEAEETENTVNLQLKEETDNTVIVDS